MLKLLMTLFCLTVVTAMEGQCPPESHLQPCTCTSTAVETYLTCNQLKGQDLDHVFARTQNDTFDHIEITRSQLVSIPARSLELKRFTSLRIARSSMFSLFGSRPGADIDLQARSELDSMPARSFETTRRSISSSSMSSHFGSGPGTENDLQSLTLERVTFEVGVDWSQFEKLRQVERIAIKDVVVPELDESFRENVSTMLKLLVLKRTNTSRLDNKVFSLMPDLADVRIEKNRIRTLRRSMFPITNSIETLLFNDNEIDSLPEDMFKDMPRLLRIGLRNNHISRISKNVFGQTYKHLIALILEGNPIDCDCSIKWFSSRDHHSKYVTGSCAHPLHLLGKEITEITDRQFLHCA